MSRNAVQRGGRLNFTAVNANKAGDLVYYNGFYGVVQDDVAAGDLVSLILEGVWGLPTSAFATYPQGVKVYAPASAMASGLLATSVPFFLAASVPSGGLAIGRVWATGIASSATTPVKIQLFNPNQS